MCTNHKWVKKALFITLALLAAAVYYLLSVVFVCSDPITSSIDRQFITNAIDEMKTSLTDKEYEMMLTISKDWEENTDGRVYIRKANTNLKPENFKLAVYDLYDCGFKELPMSMIIAEAGNEVGVKFIRGIVEADTATPRYETAEYGICYIYSDDPYEFVNSDKKLNNIPYNAKSIDYLEEIYDNLYVYVIYSSY